MRSSTFSSDRIDADTAGWTMFLVAVVVACGLIALHAGFWQRLGAAPFPVDSKALWSKERAEAVDGKTKLTLVGMSRLLFAIEPKELKSLTGQDNIAQLAILARGPLPTLVDLAEDPLFRGTVLLSFFPMAFLPPNSDGQKGYVDYYHKRWNINQAANRQLGQWIEQHLVARRSNYSLASMVRSQIKSGKLPTGALYLSNDEHRTFYADYERTNVPDQQIQRIKSQTLANDSASQLDEDAWRDMTVVMAQATQAIVSRGGCVILLRMPVDERIAQIESSAFPRNTYWDRLVKELAVPSIHYTDVPALKTFEFPDSVHVDQRDKASFTRALAEQLHATLGNYPACAMNLSGAL